MPHRSEIKMGIKKIAFVMTPVTDMKRARDFYENTFGLKMTESFGDGKWVEYDLPGGGCLAITTMAEGVKPASNAGSSVAFEVDDVVQTLAELKAKGVKVLIDLFESPVCQMAVVLDSEGNAICVHQAKA
jgi:predicted enzyme related to lactoylglutathione lyase